LGQFFEQRSILIDQLIDEGNRTFLESIGPQGLCLFSRCPTSSQPGLHCCYQKGVQFLFTDMFCFQLQRDFLW